ncbi:hypothetical protein [Capnocytophaga leadbetteri]|uniref:hypothetical protein n=1 Tax=Capnocytophaga leadbetteri TaxID=327575 RepID=UPI0028E785ED|nr:hypothetical protein [Capnocytophaga leadbetteri]
MKNFLENPYRIIGVLANASEKDLQQRKSKIQAFARIGKAIDSEFDFSFLPAIERSSEQIERAFASIEQAQDKVNHALFWFINATPIDAEALGLLKKGNIQKAGEIWSEIVVSRTITAKNFSAFANLSTLYLKYNNPFHRTSALRIKTDLVESEAFTDFVHLVADQTATVDTQKQLEWLIEELLIDFKDKSKKILLFSCICSTQVQQLVAKYFTQEPIHLVETEVAKAEKGRKDAPRNAYQIGKTLFATTKAPLSELQKILGSNDLNYKRLSDSVAKTLTQCSIDYVNALQETADPFDQGLELLKWANTLAVNSLTKERIAENKKTLEEIADRARNREITDAIAFLQMVKNMYEENERDIRQKIKEFERTLPSPSGQTITIKWDWERVNDNIRNSINWDRVIETITKDEIPRENITKIKAHTDANRIKQYKDLVTFLFSKLNYSQKNQVSYLKYWETSSSTSSNTRTASTSSTTTKTTSATSTQSTSSSSYSSSSSSNSRTSNSTNNSQSNVSRSSTNTSNNNKSNIYSLSDGCLATILLVIFLVVMVLILIAKLGNSK